MQFAVFLAACLFAALPAHAHKPSDSYLSFNIDGKRIAGQWDIALRDLEYAIGLDANGDGEITWGELRARHADIAAYALARLALSADGKPCTLTPTEHRVDDHTDGAYEVLKFSVECASALASAPAPRSLDVRYSLFFDLDPQHRGLANFRLGTNASAGDGASAPGGNGASASAQPGSRTAIFSPERATQRIELSAPSAIETLIDYAREGVWHIWVGYDHVLFLLSLLLPAVLVLRTNYGHKRWAPVGRAGDAFWDVLRVVTAFTVAHSITLSAAALGLIELPSRLVESAIAASVVLAALNNVFPRVEGRRWVVAFCFGLIHGFGFASVLADLGLPSNALLLALFGFNLGVECGQLAIVAVFLPLAFAARASWAYSRLAMAGGSMLIALLAAGWFIERAFNLKFLPF